MKLHLPKMLLTAVLAVVAGGSMASGMTIESGKYIANIDTRADNASYDGTLYSYTDGVLTLKDTSMNPFEATITLDYDAFAAVTSNTEIIYVRGTNDKNATNEWGFLATADGTVDGKWNAGTYNYLAAIMSKDDLANLATGTGTEQVITGLKVSLRSGDVGASLTTSDGTAVFVCGSLTAGSSTLHDVTIKKSLVPLITLKDNREDYTLVTNASGTWVHNFETANTYIVASERSQLGSGNDNLLNGTDADDNPVKKSIVVGAAGQLFLQSWIDGGNPDALNVERDIYIGATSYTESGAGAAYNNVALRFGNDATSAGGNVINVSGNIYVVEDAIMMSNSTNAINFTGAVTDIVDGVDTDSTLTIKGKGYSFTGDVNLSGLVVSDGAEVTFGTDSTLTIGSTIENSGSLVLNGTVAVSSSDLSTFDYGLYSEGGTTNGSYDYGYRYQLVSGSGTLSGSTTQVTYNGNTYNIADGIKIAKGSAYVVASDTVQVGGDNAAADTKDATKFLVYKDATLQLNAREEGAALSAGKVIGTAEGEGIIDLHTTATINDATDNSITATTFTGDIKISSGGVLQLCDNRFPETGGGDTSNRTIDLSSLNGIELAGGELRYRGASSSLGNIKVSADSTLYVFDMHDGANEVTVEKLNLTSASQLSLTSRWKSTTNIKVLTGDGTLNVSAAKESGAPKQVKIASTEDFTGKINQTGGTIRATAGLTVGEISQTAGTLQLTTGTTTITKGMDVQTMDVTGLTMLVLGTREGNSTTETYKIGQITGSTKLEVNEGTLELGAQKTNSVSLLDLSCGGKSDAAVTVKQGGTLNVTNSLWMRNSDANKINLEENAQLNVTYNVDSHHQVNIKGKSNGATLTNSGDSGYTLGSTTYTISNADVTISDNGSAAEELVVTLSNILDGSSLTNSSTKTLKTTNGNSNFTAIDAKSGDINLTYFNEQNKQGTLQSLSIGDSRSIGIYKNAVPDTPATDNEATVTVASLTAGTGATLNANLVLVDNATVSLADALTMGSTLTLGTGMTLDGALLTSVTGLSEGETVNLFESVETFVLGGTTYDASNLLAEGTEQLNQYFTNVTNNNIYLAYNGGTVFAGIMSIPEPTTATLSLLALAGLAARRRRK